MKVNRTNLRSLLAAAMICGVAVAQSGAATAATMATVTTSFPVSATVLSTCTVTAPSAGLSFGNYSPTSATVGQVTITVQCTPSTTYNVGLNAGTASGATVTSRAMQNGSNLLNYYLTQTATTVTSTVPPSGNWGDTVGTDTVAGTGSGSAQTLTVYGLIPSGQYVPPGVYNDTITATVTY